MFPSVFKESSMFFSNVFLLLALRRILSLPSEKNTEKKILDASIWIAIATLFNFWSVLFLVVLFVAIFQQITNNYKYILIPFVGITAVFTLTTVYYLLVNDSFLWFLNMKTTIGFDFSEYKSPQLLIPIIFLTFTVLLSIVFKLLNTKNTPLKEKSKFNILFFMLLIGILVIVVSPSKNGSEFIFLFAPTSIFIANYLESIKKVWVSETILWVTVLLPFLIYSL